MKKLVQELIALDARSQEIVSQIRDRVRTTAVLFGVYKESADGYGTYPIRMGQIYSWCLAGENFWINWDDSNGETRGFMLPIHYVYDDEAFSRFKEDSLKEEQLRIEMDRHQEAERKLAQIKDPQRQIEGLQ